MNVSYPRGFCGSRIQCGLASWFWLRSLTRSSSSEASAVAHPQHWLVLELQEVSVLAPQSAAVSSRPQIKRHKGTRESQADATLFMTRPWPSYSVRYLYHILSLRSESQRTAHICGEELDFTFFFFVED